jgi:DNA modification methylase
MTAKNGDIWILGNHRLMCGDAAKHDDLAALTENGTADLMLTDPPYGLTSADLPHNTAKHPLPWWMYAPSKDTLTALLLLANHAIIFGGQFFAASLPIGRHWIVWDKKNTAPSLSDCELLWTNIPKKSIKKYEVTWNGMQGRDKNTTHPTQKPLAFLRALVEEYCPPGGIVLDPFGGSGTTLIACEDTGISCRMMEISPAYCEIIISRWEKLTGSKAEILKREKG